MLTFNKDVNLYVNDLKNSLNLLNSRGPDNKGVFSSKNIWIGHNRLSIIDLKNGNQPMVSNCKKYIVSFNGEIYNFRELKKKYTYNYNTQSDTELILAAYINDGVECFEKFRGMFAFAIVDLIKKEIVIVRDRFGIKPMVYYANDEYFIFSSEIKSIIPFLNNKIVNTNSINEFFLRRFITSPETIYENVFKLNPGEYIKQSFDKKTFFKKKFTLPIDEKVFNSKSGDKDDIVILKEALKTSVKKHMISDVPVGIFLSGGIDSSIIAYLASLNNPSIDTFTVGIRNDKNNDDLEYSRQVSNYLKLKHHEIICDSISKDELVKVVKYFDEPFADTSILFYYILCKNCSKNFKVCLSGDGADEVFYGYNFYRNITNTKTVFSKKLYKLIFFLSFINDKFYPLLNKFSYNSDEKYSLGCYGMSKYYIESIFGKITNNINLPDINDITNLRNYDLNVNLPNYYLQKVDKISMLNSLEVRVPFVDIEVLKIANNINYSKFTNSNEGKILLKEIFKNDLPSSILTRKKQGFVRDWKYIFKDDFEELFNYYVNTELIELLNLNPKIIKKIFKYKTSINLLLQWRLLVFGIWFRENYSFK